MQSVCANGCDGIGDGCIGFVNERTRLGVQLLPMVNLGLDGFAAMWRVVRRQVPRIARIMAIIRGTGRKVLSRESSCLFMEMTPLRSFGRFEGASRPLRYYDAKELVFQHLAIPLEMDGKNSGRMFDNWKDSNYSMFRSFITAL